MLPNATTFPQPGSYCLWGADPEQARPDPQLARIHYWTGTTGGPDDEAVISLPLVTGSTGTRRVLRAELQDATALTPAEAREYEGLQNKGLSANLAAVHPRRNLSRRQRGRFDLLHARAGRAAILAHLLGQLAHHQRAMSRAA